jgi:tetratricopeptide (TPR) repeat protein
MRPLLWLLVACLFLSGAGILQAQSSTETEEEDDCDKPAIQNADPTYYIGLGDSRFARKEFAGAVKAYTCAIDLDSSYASTYAKRGYAYAALLDSDAALADYDKALELDEALVAAYNNRGTLYTRLGNFGLAINDFTLVISLDPENAIAYNNRGIVHAAEGNYDLAIADFQQAITLDPAYGTPHASLAAVYSALAAKSYQTFVKVAGQNARLPAGTPGEVLTAIDDSLRDGNFAVWLPLLTPAE